MKESPSAYNRLGMALGERGRFAEAIEAFERALALKPDFAAAHHNIGLALWHLGRADAAMEAFRRAIDYDPSNVEPYCGLGRALIDLDRTEEALDLLASAGDSIPLAYKAQLLAGRGWEKLLDWSGAATAYRRAMELNPFSAEAYVALASLDLFILDQPDEAVEILNRALEIEPNNARAQKLLDEAIEFMVR